MGYIFQPLRYQLLELITKHASYVRGKTLDVGCGPVARYQRLFKNCTEYIKMDIESGENVDVVGFAEAIPFPDSSFDSLVCTETIQDVFDLQKAFSEFNRVLRKDGILMVSSASIFKQHDSSNDYWRFTQHSFRKLATSARFTVEVLDQRGAFWSALVQLWVSYWILKLNVYGAWYERPFAIGASIFGKAAMWLDRFDKGHVRASFTTGYLMIAKKN